MSFKPEIPYNELPNLPPKEDFNDVELLKLVNKANNSIYELKGAAHILPNRFVLISPFSIREGVASNGVENINTTVSEVLKADIIYEESELAGAEKEVLNYRNALMKGFQIFNERGFLNSNDFIKIQAILEPSKKGIRNVSDIAIRNSKTKKIIYTPPEGKDILNDKLKNFEDYFNDKEGFEDIDPLIRMAIMHYQFEAIHPFLEGNGRTGRILMVLYLVIVERLDLPTLFISKYILENRDEYYKLLLEVTKEGNWKNWIKYILVGIDRQAKETRNKILEIKQLIIEQKEIGVNKKSNILSSEMVDYLFSNSFYSQKKMAEQLGIHRNTASKYFSELEKIGIVNKFKYKKENIYYNEKFLNLLSY
ncbi:MAG: Fic family protein [Candidatus Pacebacteria bacterium]|nr:Fic family protein [Candidatus Paceibacterota bacterium]